MRTSSGPQTIRCTTLLQVSVQGMQTSAYWNEEKFKQSETLLFVPVSH
jgi:hypothetical protein